VNQEQFVDPINIAFVGGGTWPDVEEHPGDHGGWTHHDGTI
jgi:hypothetical protein